MVVVCRFSGGERWINEKNVLLEKSMGKWIGNEKVV